MRLWWVPSAIVAFVAFFAYLTLEREDITLLWKFGNLSSNDAASDSRRREFSITAFWNPQYCHHQYSWCTVSFTLPHKKSPRITVAKWLTYLVATEAYMCTKQLSQKNRPVWWRPVPFLMLSLHSVRTYSCKFSQSLSFVQKKARTMRMRTRRWPSGCLSHALPWHVSVKISRFWLYVGVPACLDERNVAKKSSGEMLYPNLFSQIWPHQNSLSLVFQCRLMSPQFAPMCVVQGTCAAL